jgi:hypothetical protein
MYIFSWKKTGYFKVKNFLKKAKQYECYHLDTDLNHHFTTLKLNNKKSDELQIDNRLTYSSLCTKNAPTETYLSFLYKRSSKPILATILHTVLYCLRDIVKTIMFPFP